jgi:uncharacterized protein (TIGR00369 family)
MGILHEDDLLAFYLDETETIQPPFPNWQKSFISGTDSPLFQIEHKIKIKNPNLLVSRVKFKAKAEGPPGHVHGGASSALVDELMGIVVWHNQFRCLTQNLNLKYLKALPMGTDAFVVSEITHIHQRTIEVTCTIFDEKETAFVSGHGVFHRLTSEQLTKFVP